jgi:hypothetical protein
MRRPQARRKNENDDLAEAMSSAVERVRDLRRGIQKATGKVEEGWFGNLLLGILNCALLDYYSVQVGAQKSVYLAAWACRNLLELKVITRYVLASAGKALDFRNELAIDTKEFYEALTRHHQASHKNLLSMLSEVSDGEKGLVKEMLQQVLRKEVERGAKTEATDSQAAIYSQLMADFGFKKNAKPKRTSDRARLIDQSEDFDPMFKICSKIMHRTVLSIASTVTKGSIDEVIPLLSSSSENDLLTIYGLIDGHFKKRGIRPPAK